jgi:hypothetical protein
MTHIQKTIGCSLIALSVIAGLASQASAFDAKSFWEQQQQAQ